MRIFVLLQIIRIKILNFPNPKISYFTICLLRIIVWIEKESAYVKTLRSKHKLLIVIINTHINIESIRSANFIYVYVIYMYVHIHTTCLCMVKCICCCWGRSGRLSTRYIPRWFSTLFANKVGNPAFGIINDATFTCINNERKKKKRKQPFFFPLFINVSHLSINQSIPRTILS